MRIYTVGNTVKVYEYGYGVYREKKTTETIITRVTGSYYQTADGRKWALKSGREYGRGFDSWSAHINVF